MLLVFVIAFTVRAIWVTYAKVTPVSDFAHYDQLAWKWLNSGEYGSPQLRAYTTPGYPGFLAIIYALFGHNVTAAGYAQAFLTALGCGALVHLASRFFSRHTAVLAGLLYSFSPTAVAYTPVLASENLAAPLLLITLAMAASDGRRTPGFAAALTGISYGLFFLTRPAGIFFLPGIILLFGGHRLWQPDARRKLLVFAGTLTLSLSPWISYKYRHGLGLSPLSTNGGINMWLGNNPCATHGGYCPDAELIEPQNEKSDNARYMAKALDWIRHHPRRYFQLCLVRAMRLLGTPPDRWATRYFSPTVEHDRATRMILGVLPKEQQDNELINRVYKIDKRNEELGEILRVVFAPVSIASLLLSLGKLKRLYPFMTPFLMYLLGLSLTFAQPRFRELSDPLFYTLVAGLISDLLFGTQELGNRRRRLLSAIVTFLPLGLCTAAYYTGDLYDLYLLRPLVEYDPLPDADKYRFEPLVFHEPISEYASTLWGNQGEKVDLCLKKGGIRCTVTVPDERGHYGGLMFPAYGAEALRLSIRILTLRNVQAVYIDGYDDKLHRVARWERSVNTALPLTRHILELTLLPGVNTRGYCWVPPKHHGTINTVHIFVRVMPGTTAVFDVTQVELGHRDETDTQPIPNLEQP